MTAPRNPERTLEAFLADGPMELPDRALDAVRRDIHRTRQRVVIGPWKEPTMSVLSRLAIAAAVIVAVGFAWINFGPRVLGPGGPTPSPNGTIGPSPSPVLINGQGGLLVPGRYVFAYSNAAGADGMTGPSIAITVPSTATKLIRFMNMGSGAATILVLDMKVGANN